MQSTLAASLRRWTFLVLFFSTALPAVMAAPEPSLLPPFGAEGKEFTSKAQNNHVVQGWLPKDWDDNTEWAPITATYSKLDDSPDPGSTALRIDLEKMDDGQLQLTSYAGERLYEHGKTYRIMGWLRSSNQVAVAVAVRQSADPYERYYEQELMADGTWKQFNFDFTPQKDIKAIIMFMVKNVGTLDLAGVIVTDKITAISPPAAQPVPTAAAAKSLLPALGPDGENVTVKAKGDHIVQGWLPTGWNDNTEWAAINATYSKLNESPVKEAPALRITVEKMDDGQLQLTSYTAERIYDHGRIYRVTGWLRSPESDAVSVGARQSEDPYEMYFEKELPTGKEWKQFEFEFAPKMDIKALIMFCVKNAGTVDLAGVTMTDEGSAE